MAGKKFDITKFAATLPEAVRRGKDYVTGALMDGMDLGRGNGPLNHCYAMQPGLPWLEP